MIVDKIDKNLGQIISIMQQREGVECLVRTSNSQSLRQYINKFSKKIIKVYEFINSFSARLTKKEIISLSQKDSVAYISSNASVFALMNVAKKVLHIPKKCYGEGQTICFIDTGIYPHFDFIFPNNKIIKLYMNAKTK